MSSAILPRLQLVAFCAALLLAGIATQWTGAVGGSALAPWVLELSGSGALALGWLLMAFALGTPIQRALAPESESPMALRLGIGALAALALVSLVGSVGWPGGRVVAIGIYAIGAVSGAAIVLRALLRTPTSDVPYRGMSGPWLGLLVAAPALAALAVAAAAPPGWLWATEFHGYDALSYHLQMPREWMELGRIVPLEHCVYAAMPNAMEAAFLHLMLVWGNALDVGVACQFLHAGFAVATALVVGAAARAWLARAGVDRSGASIAATVATALVLATPWTVVVGSLAYSEMAVTLAFATGLLLLGDRSIGPVRGAIAAGGCAGVACAAKLSAVGMVALPLALVALLVVPPRRWLVAGLGGAALAAVVLAPWLIRNWIGCGSPTFPFLPSLFGTAWWSDEQMATWASAHHAGTHEGSSLLRLWQQWFTFGLGTAPQDGEPWRTQWALVPWLGLAAVGVLALRRRTVALALAGATVVVPIAFWMVATHMQSRFLVPTVVPLALLVGLGVAILDTGTSGRRLSRHAAIVATALLAFWPLALLHGERQGAPAAAIGQMAFFTGDAELGAWQEAQRSRVTRRAFLDAAPPAFWTNHLLGDEATVLFVGHATPWYHGQGDSRSMAEFRWQTVWDRGPLSRVVAAHPDAPQRWRRALRDEGFTHALVDLAMLARWRRSGWLDPRLTPDAIDALVGPPDEVIAASPIGVVLVELSAE